jgi:hypothetical protein
MQKAPRWRGLSYTKLGGLSGKQVLDLTNQVQ